MRKFDKTKNIKKTNILAEQRYLQSKGLLKENNMFEEPTQQGPSNEDYVKHFLDNFYTGVDDMEYGGEDDLYVEFKLKYNDDEDLKYWVNLEFTTEDSLIQLYDVSFDIGWDEEKEEFLRSFNLNVNTKSLEPVVDFVKQKFIRNYGKR